MKKRKSIGLCIAMMASSMLSNTSPVVYADVPVLIQQGAKGNSVIELQQILTKLGYLSDKVDGQFGSHTTAAVQAFQRANHLPATGVVDDRTWALLTKASTISTSPKTTVSSTTISNFRQTKIYFSNKLVASPYAFTSQGTTYMPVWYVMQMLKAVNVQTTWDGKALNLTVPSSVPVDLTNISLGSGVQTICINGTPVARVSGIPYSDPYTHKPTQYMPIWYLQRALNRLNIHSTWNGTEWFMTQLPIYVSYSPDGKTVGTYQTLDSAKQALSQLPGGTVKDSTGKVVFTQPQPVTYSALAADGTVLGTYSTLTDAKNALANSPNGTVKDSQGNVLYTQPQPVVYTDYTASGIIIGTYPSLSDAKNALTNQPGGTVQDNSGKVVYTQPQPVTYTASLVGGMSIGNFTTLSDAETAIASSPGATVKDSNGKLLYTQPTPYVAYSQNNTIVGLYTQLSDAEAVIRTYAGGYVKDNSGTTVFTASRSPIYVVYTGSGTQSGTYTTLSDAELALSGVSGGVVKDNAGNVVYTQSGSVQYRAYQPSGVVTSAVPYQSLTDAKNAVANIPGGMVKDTAGNVLYVQPITQSYVSLSKSGALVGVYSTLSDAQLSLASYPGGTVIASDGSIAYTQPGGNGSQNPGPSINPDGFKTVDLRFAAPSNITASSIDQYLTSKGSPMAGLGQAFIYAQKTYGVDANYLVSHAILESAWGKSSIALAKDNLFGYGAYDSNPGTDAGRFPSYEYAIRFQAWEVRQNYLTPGSSLYVTPTLVGMNVHYATDQFWANSIGGLMGQFASTVGDSVKSYQQYSPSKQPPAPSASGEPVFLLNGATAVVSGTPYYPNLPYYPDWATGNSQMFIRVLQSGQNGGDVATLQRALNQKANSRLTVDGSFGPMTTVALKKYQQSQGLTATGTCDFKLWNTLVPAPVNTIPAKKTVTVDKMMQGMSAGIVMEWYHVPNYGWVNSQFVKFTNTYRLTVSSPTSPSAGRVQIFDPNNPSNVIATMHAGDWVVSTNPSATSGFITIQCVNQQTGQAMKGVIDASQTKLTAIQ